MKVEICASSLLSVKNAISAGADRVELRSAFQLGGITPSKGLIEEAVKLDKIQIHCLRHRTDWSRHTGRYCRTDWSKHTGRCHRTD